MVQSYSLDVLIVYRSLVDEWEVDAVAQKLDDPSSIDNVNHYCLVKNLLVQALIQNHDTWKKAKDLATVVKHDCNRVRESLTLMNQKRKLEFPQQEALMAEESSLKDF